MRSRELAFGAALLALAACATPQPPGYLTLRTCETSAAVIERLAVQRRAGLLSATEIRRVDELIAILDPVCSSTTPPTSDQQALVLHALEQLEAILAEEAAE